MRQTVPRSGGGNKEYLQHSTDEYKVMSGASPEGGGAAYPACPSGGGGAVLPAAGACGPTPMDEGAGGGVLHEKAQEQHFEEELADFVLAMLDKLKRAQQAASGGDWKDAAEQLLLVDEGRPRASLVVGGWQACVTFWGGQTVAGRVRLDEGTAVLDAYKELYLYLEPVWRSWAKMRRQCAEGSHGRDYRRQRAEGGHGHDERSGASGYHPLQFGHPRPS